eukprot:1183343-Prorocentrum_minimum.AAC.2
MSRRMRRGVESSSEGFRSGSNGVVIREWWTERAWRGASGGLYGVSVPNRVTPITRSPTFSERVQFSPTSSTTPLNSNPCEARTIQEQGENPN